MKDREECWAQVQEHASIHACCVGPLPFTDLDLLDSPPLAFPHREALYKDKWNSGRAPEEEYREEFGGVHKPELLNEAVEVGDWIYATTVHPPPSITEIQASQTTSQQLSQVFTTNTAL
ncbi:hypothetical protein C0989_002971 [Termitomyces sp. Mn162]|nr:hypothetical protein C0989_002971 [Termitomyces sp. Mn162]